MREFKDRIMTLKYYRLKNNKLMGDETVIYSKTLLRKISAFSEKKFMVETVEENTKKIFWVEKKEVELIKKEKEFWTAEQLIRIDKAKKGIWL